MLSGRIALVTGASRGIGRAIAIELGKLGATAIGTATSAEGAERIREILTQAGVSGEGVVMNVDDANMVDSAFKQIQQRYGDIAILVNNAGITSDNLLLRMRDDDWDRVLDTDLKSAYRLCKLALRPMMKARYGRIINITSVVGEMGNAGQSNYAAAKAGLVGFRNRCTRSG